MFRVKAENFLSYKELDFDFTNRGLCLIEGVNKEEPSCKSNGAGKTSLIDSLCWGLYGKSFKVVAADKVVNIKEGGNCMVEVEWHNYRVVRYRKHTKFKNDLQFYQDGNEITAKSNKDTQELIDNALGLSYESFVNSVYFQQNNLTTFATATDSEQKAIIENILGFNLLSEAQVVAKEIVKEFDTSLITLKLKNANSQKSHNECKERIVYLHNSSNEWFRKADQEFEEITSKIKGYEELKNTTKVDFNFAEAQQLLATAEQITPQIKKLEEKLIELNNALFSITSSRMQIQHEIKKTESEKAAKQRELAIYDTYQTPTCPACKQAMPQNDFFANIGVLIEEIETRDASVSHLKEQLEGLTTDNAIKAERDVTQQKIDSLRNSQELTNKLKVRVAQETAKLEQLKMIDSYIADLNERKKKLQNTENPYSVELNVEKGREQVLYAEMFELNKMLADASTERAYYQYWVDGLANSKLKSYIMDSITPMLNERANYYAGFMTGGSIQIEISTQTKLKTGEMRDKFSVNIHSVTGADYELCSGGEKKRIDICILLALQDLVRTRAKHPIDLVIMDEICENLDEVGIERLVDMLHNISNERGTCLYVTHSEDMKPLFPNVITVVKQNGTSSVINE